MDKEVKFGLAILWTLIMGGVGFSAWASTQPYIPAIPLYLMMCLLMAVGIWATRRVR